MGEPDTLKSFPILFLIQKMGLDDSRRIVHSLKVGLALTLASLLVLLKRPYDWIGANANWAVLTVVVVFETSAGTTFSKGLNRGLGTVLAGLLALGAAHLADLLQATAEPISIGAMVFITGSVCTFTRANPTVKKRFDYGVVIFMLTFCMVLVTGYRTGDEVMMGSTRLLTIMIGGLICLAVSAFVFPHWAGRDLHRLTANNFKELGKALEECVKEYLSGRGQPITSTMVLDDADPVYNTCHEAIKSRNTEEALVVSATWEPPHGRFRFGYPWKQYLTVGAMLRNCAYSVLALHGHIHSQIQAPSSLRIIFAKEMITASQDAADLLHELGTCISNMHKPKGSTEDLKKKISQASEGIKQLISEHSYLFATPESWAALDGKLHERISGTQTWCTLEKEKVLPQDRLASLIWIKPIELAPYQNRCSHPSGSVQDHIEGNSQEKLVPDGGDHPQRFSIKQPKPQTVFEGNSQVKLVNVLQPDEHERGGRQLVVSINERKSQTHLDDGIARNLCDDGETTEFSPECKINLSCSVSVDKDFERRRVEDIASAASLVSFASLLIETLARLDHVVEAVETLSESGRFTACTCDQRHGHLERRCASVRDTKSKRSSSHLDRVVRKDLRSARNSKSSRHLPGNNMQGGVE